MYELYAPYLVKSGGEGTFLLPGASGVNRGRGTRVTGNPDDLITRISG